MCAEGAALRRGQLEREGGGERSQCGVIAADGPGGRPSEAPACRQDAQLQDEELVEAQPTVRGRQAFVIVREVDLGQRLRQRQQPGLAPHLFRQEVGCLGRKRLNRAIEHPAQPLHGNPLGQGIDRRQTAGAELVPVQRLELRIADHRHVAVVVDLPAEGIGVPRVQLALDEGIEPRHLHLARAIPHHGGDQAPIFADDAALEIPDGADDRDFFAPLQTVNGAELAEVVITIR